MTMTEEFYEDDLVVVSAEGGEGTLVGLVTKERPSSGAFIHARVTECEVGEQPALEAQCDEEEETAESEGNLYDPPQTESVNVSWFIHSHIKDMGDSYDMTYVESISGSKLSLFDRSLAVSDIVKMNILDTVKVGTVSTLKIRADVLVIGQDRIIRDIDCSRLKWIEPYMGKNLETNFTYESWLGEVLDVTIDVIISFVDGARLKVPGTTLNDFDNQISPIWNPETILEGCTMEGDASDLKSRKSKFLFETSRFNSKWLCKCKGEVVQILIEKVIPIQADMQWVFGYNNKESSLVPESPPLTLKYKEIEKLEQVHPYPWHSLGVGDIWYYKLAEDDKLIDINSADSMESVMYKLLNGQLNQSAQHVVSENDVVEDDHLENHKLVDNQISNTCIVKPRKKILCSIRNRNRRRQFSSVISKISQSSDDESESNDDNNKHKKTQENKTLESNDVLLQRNINLDMLKKESFNRLRPNNMFPVGILLTKCSVDISWQDGTKSYDIPTKNLLPQMYNIDEHDFFPGDFIVQKFDAKNIDNEQTKHYFGTVIKAESKERIATVQWFDYDQNDSTKGHLTKYGEPETIGVYDISALNEHHFVLGQEVIIKEEVAHKKYPAGFVTRLEPNDGMLVIRWPDNSEIAMSPTDLLLTVESAIGADSMSSDDSECDDSDHLSSDLSSESNSTEWETVEEVDANQEDESYILKLNHARNELSELLEKITKVQLAIGNVTDFTLILRANLPTHTGQLLNIKDLFNQEEDDQNTALENNEIDGLVKDQQVAFRTLYEIRQNIGIIYKQCNDIEIKRMFQCYRPKDFLSFRLIKNFIISNVQFKPNIDSGNNDSSFKQNGNAVVETMTKQTDDMMNWTLDSSCNKERKSRDIVADYLKTLYVNIKANLQFLKESIDIWLMEKSCYLNKEIQITQKKEETIEIPKVSFTEEQLMIDDIYVEDQPKQPHTVIIDPLLPGDTTHIISEDIKPEVPRTDSSDHTISICEPIPVEQRGHFIMVESAPNSHKYISSARPSLSNIKFNKAWKRDIKLLSTSLPKGVFVKSFDDRIDLFSVMIVGPSGTPYQHALFFFDIQLGIQYPTTQPSVFYISLVSERVNPNLYTEGRVCLSLLGTWNGKGTENWDSKLSSLLQLIVSLQGLILVSEPYYNEAGFEIRKGSEEGKQNSQRYNESTINNICQSMIHLLQKPIPVFEKEIYEHFKEHGESLIEIHEYWSSLDVANLNRNIDKLFLPDFPLAPVSRGFQLSLQRHLIALKNIFAEKKLEWLVVLN